MNALHSVRVCTLLAAALTGPLAGRLEAQAGISSRVSQVALVVRAPASASMPAVSAYREIGRRGDLREAAVRIHLLANSRYRLVARGNHGAASRLWIHVADDRYEELQPGGSMTLPAASGGRTVQEVRYMTDGSTSLAEIPVRFELVVDPAI